MGGVGSGSCGHRPLLEHGLSTWLEVAAAKASALIATPRLQSVITLLSILSDV
jgi:hypothetical protein